MLARLLRCTTPVTRAFLADCRNKRFQNKDCSFGSSHNKNQRNFCALRSLGQLSSHINQQRGGIRMASGVDLRTETYQFGPFTIRESEVFASSQLSLALVNLKPVVPGHVLIIPRRVVQRFQELSPEEVTDIWMLAQRVGSKIEPHFQAAALTMAIQDGPAAGQTVPHVHIHILPRKVGDFENNDEIYDKIDEHATKMREKLDLDKERKVRTPEEMAQEAAELRSSFDKQSL